MEERVTYQVLSPDSVAWHIQAALTADRSGNEAARDMALREAQRVAGERRLVETAGCYDCRTTGERLVAIESRLDRVDHRVMKHTEYIAELSRSAALEAAAAAAVASAMGQRLADLERNQRVDHRTMHATFNQHQARLDGHAEQLSTLGDQAAALDIAIGQGLADLESPSPRRHDGGYWITCPFCQDDETGMCSACNGTRRIWEMPAEDGG